MIGVIQIVTMDHPQSRIVCIEGDLIGFMRSYTDGVEMDRTSCEQMPILCQHRKCMSMQMHRVIACICVVHKTQPDQLSWFDHEQDRKSTRLNSSHSQISYAVFCLKKKKQDWY